MPPQQMSADDKITLPLLPVDCKQHILGFLDISDTFKYGETCRLALQDCIRQIQQRRQRTFFSDILSQLPVSQEPQSHATSSRLNQEGDRSTLKDRLVYLLGVFPPNHSCRSKLKKLVDGLEENSAGETGKQADEPTTRLSTDTFLEALETLKASSLELGLLHEISKATFLDAPQFESMEAVHRGNASGTVTLHQYVGDVLLWTYLLPLVEHRVIKSTSLPLCPTGLYRFLNYYERRRQNGGLSSSDEEHTSAYYRFMIGVQSLILRNAPRDTARHMSMGLFPEDIDATAESPADNLYLPLRHLRLDGRSCRQAKRSYLLRDQVEMILTLTNFCLTKISMSIRLNDFGPLGPAFRGRDNIQSIRLSENQYSMTLRVLGDILGRRVQPSPQALQAMTEVVTSFSVMFEACRRTQPMTVEPSLVTIHHPARQD